MMSSDKTYEDVLVSLKDSYESELMQCRQLQSRVSQRTKERDLLLTKFNAVSIDMKFLQQDVNRKRAEMNGYTEAKLTLRRQIDAEKALFDDKSSKLIDLQKAIDVIRQRKADCRNTHCDDMMIMKQNYLKVREEQR